MTALRARRCLPAGRREISRRIGVCVFALLVVCTPVLAKNGAYRDTRHGDRVKGPMRRADQPRGSCVQCHDGHATHDRVPGSNAAGLFAANDNELCFSCHAPAGEGGAFGGSIIWQQSTHGRLDAATTGATSSATLQCIFCHDPHGVRDSKGIIPGLARSRSAELCTQCHDGSRASDIRSQLTRSFVHGSQARGAHDAHESESSAFASIPANNRHIDCADCHNVHTSGAGSRTESVSRVEVDPSSTVGSIRYTFRPASDHGIGNEYEVCFKCHSSWTRLPARQPDLAQLTLPTNPSFHPIQGEGRNRGIAADAFASGYRADSRVTCSDCHGSDDERERGVHASRYQHLLKRPYADGSGFEAANQDDLCFACHSYDVYASEASDSSRRAASRFNDPSSAGHVFHVAKQQIACGSCHDPHGSTRYPSLLVRVNGRGISDYTQSATGGTCRTSCHQERSYTVNYAR